MPLLAKSLLVLVLFIISRHLFAGDLVLEVKEGSGDGMAIEIKPDSLDMGTITPGGKSERTIELENRLASEIKLNPLRSPCTCLAISGAPEAIKPGGMASLVFKLIGEGYRGSFTKYAHMRLKAENQEKDIFIPVKFTILNEDAEASNALTPGRSPDVAGPLEFIEYKGGSFESYAEAAAWIFAGKGCPGCVPLRRELLPKLLLKDRASSAKPKVVSVNLDDRSGFILLSDLEEKLGAKGEKTPVLYYQGKLIYGNEAVKSLIKE